MRRFFYRPAEVPKPPFSLGDGLILLGLAALIYVGARLGLRVPEVIARPEISLSFRALPWYALFSVGRMLVAYVLSLAFSLTYGYYAARNRTAERVMMPTLDVLQSVPILSFLPVVLLSFSAVLPQALAAEIAAIVLIFTSQAWNMTFSFYQSATTIPIEQREAAAIFRLDPWLRFRTMELPFAALGLVWNSIMSWSGGWFFLMAAEMFVVGSRNFALPGLGSYLQTAANAGDKPAIAGGLTTLVLVILLLDQFVWRPVLAWTNKYKVEMVMSEETPTSWFLEVLTRSWLFQQFTRHLLHPLSERLDGGLRRRFGSRPPNSVEEKVAGRPSRATIVIGIVVGAIILYGGYQAVRLAATLPADMWPQVGIGVLATLTRVIVALALTLLWTIPAGVLIGTSPRMARVLQPVVQIVAAIPATAIFPVLLLVLLSVPGGLNIAAIGLMLLGTQWYLLFNVIAGSTAIPQDLKFTTELLQLSRRDRWRTLILPALFPFVITGAITASGGAWNASIVAEQVQFGGQTYSVVGVGALIAQATATGNYALLLVATVALVGTVVAINRLFWRRMYRLAETRYRME